jgi:single-strand DNA-binding protein
MKSVNKVILLGNLTRDPELKQSEGKKPVCVLGLATNRSWSIKPGETQFDTTYHRIVAFDKLAETCHQYLKKGRKVYVEGRLQSRSYTGQDGSEKFATEIVIDDLVMLDPMPQAVREALDFHDTKEI